MVMVNGVFTTGNVNQDLRVRDVSPSIAYTAPRIAQILFFSARMAPAPMTNAFGVMEAGARGVSANIRTVTNFKYEWPEFESKTNTTQVNNGGGYNSAATSIVVDDASIFAPNDLVDVVASGEMLEVLTVNTSTNTITVTRSWGATAAAAIADNAYLLIIGNAFSENAPNVIQPQKNPTLNYNYIQDTRHGFAGTYVLDRSELYYGDQRSFLRKAFLIDHQKYLEASYLFGQKNDGTGSDGSPKKTTSGILEYVTTNVTDVAGVLTKAAWNSWLRDIFTFGSPEKIVFASPLVAGAVSSFAADNSGPPVSQIWVVNNAKEFGLNIMTYTTKFGTVHLVMHGMLTGSVYQGYAIAMDPENLELARVRNGFFLNLREDIIKDGAHRWVDEYATYHGFTYKAEKTAGVLSGVTG